MHWTRDGDTAPLLNNFPSNGFKQSNNCFLKVQEKNTSSDRFNPCLFQIGKGTSCFLIRLNRCLLRCADFYGQHRSRTISFESCRLYSTRVLAEKAGVLLFGTRWLTHFGQRDIVGFSWKFGHQIIVQSHSIETGVWKLCRSCTVITDKVWDT